MSSKSAEKAETTQKALGSDTSGSVGNVSTDCAVVKHWIAVHVQDTDGNPVTDIQPTIEVDGSVLTPSLNKDGKYNTGKVLNSADPAKISFPTLFDCDWWEGGGTAPTPTAEQDLTVADGDCVVKMAADKTFRSYHDIWDVGANAPLKVNRPNLNALVIGDTLKAPSKKEKKVTKAVDNEWPFTVRALKKPKLRIVIVDKDLNPIKGVKWVLSGVAAKNGTTGGDGLAELPELDPTATSGSLNVSVTPPTKPFSLALPDVGGMVASWFASAPTEPPYPAPLKPADFKDKDPAKPTPATELNFDLKIGSLPSHKDKTGSIARLHNFGYNCDLTSTDDQLTRAVKNYQKAILKQQSPTGAYADIQEQLESKHSNP